MEKQIKNNYCFLAIGTTNDTTEQQAAFSRYVGLASARIMAVNPDKKTLDSLLGYETANAPEYVVDGGKEARVTFVMRTVPEDNDGIEITNLLTFYLRNTPAYNSTETRVQVIDHYGNHSSVEVETAKAGTALPSNYKIDQAHYRIAREGEVALVVFLKEYLGVPSALGYTNGSWFLSDKAANGIFELEHINDYFRGDFSEIKKAIAMRPDNKIKLLYGVNNKDGKSYQTICSYPDYMLRNSAPQSQEDKMKETLKRAYERGSFATTVYAVQPLQEFKVEASDLSKAPQEDDAASFFTEPAAEAIPTGSEGGLLPWE